jgi:hypothetical protein
LTLERSGELVFCAERAREAGDPLEGTATKATVWLLLEYREVWARKAVTDNNLPGLVQAYLDAQLAAIPGSRLLFIKRPEATGARLRFFIARADETTPELYEFDLAGYEELLGLDIATVATAGGGSKSEAPLFLICGNGRRDKCCAKFGLPAYRALRRQQPQATWLSTHIGGHR